MAIVGQTQTLPEDWDRIDCAKQHGQPWAPVQIGAYRFSVKPGGRLSLYVRGAHSLCQDYCYKWRIVRGGGQLSDLYGKRVVYQAPAEQPECKDNPIVQLEYCGEVMDQAYIAIASFVSDDVAYVSAGPFREGFWPHKNSCVPYRVEPHEWIDCKYVAGTPKPDVVYQSSAWCSDTPILKSCITMRTHACDGRVLSKTTIGLRQRCIDWGCGTEVPKAGQWEARSGGGFFPGGSLWIDNTSYGQAKQWLLDGWVLELWDKNWKTLSELFPEGWTPGDPLPDGVTLEGPREFPEKWYSGDPAPENLKLEEGTLFPPGWIAGDPLPEGVNVEEDAWFPPDWTVTDPLPEGVTLDLGSYFPDDWTAGDKLPEGASFPTGEYFDKGWTAGDQMPENVSVAEGSSFPAEWYSGDPLPEGVTLDQGAVIPFDWQPGDEVPEGLNLPPLWPEGRPKWWIDKLKGGLLIERGILDIRPPELLEEDCCVPEEEWQPT